MSLTINISLNDGHGALLTTAMTAIVRHCCHQSLQWLIASVPRRKVPLASHPLHLVYGDLNSKISFITAPSLPSETLRSL
jgi:hypothetical protein